jgi:4-hydroxy-2-oxoheptanedioate aldolase
MKAAMLAKTPMVGVSMMFSSPQLVEMIAALGFDWVLFDCEHGSIDLSNLEVMAIAAKAAGITAIARPPSHSPTLPFSHSPILPFSHSPILPLIL